MFSIIHQQVSDCKIINSLMTMKVTILILTLVAVTASVAYAAPLEDKDAEVEAFLEKLVKQEMALQQDDDDDELEAAVQEMFAREQVPAQLQGWFRKLTKKVGKAIKKHGPKIIKYGIKYGLPLLG